jgi:hypothetical protein
MQDLEGDSMGLFGVIKTDEAIFAGDKTRIDVSQSFVSPEETQTFTLEIKALDAVEFIDVSAKKYLDWLYLTPGAHTITLKMVAGLKTELFTQVVNVLDVQELKLFSKDSDLMIFEPEILLRLPRKWSSFNVIHYKVQKQILKKLAEKGIVANDQSVITVDEILDVEEVRDLSCYMALALIFEGAQNQRGDMFDEKSKEYAGKAFEKFNAAVIRLDVSKTGVATPVDNFTGRMERG